MPKTDHDNALTAASKALHDWEHELEEATAAAAAAEAHQPASPEETRAIARDRMEARERLAVATAAVTHAQHVELAARRAAVDAEADKLAAPIAAVQRKIDAHNRTTDKLRKDLEDHTGHAWSPESLQMIDPGTLQVRPLTRGGALAAELRALEAQRDALRAAARGEEPALPADQLPAALGIDGILPARVAIESARQAAEEKELADRRTREQAALDAAASVLGKIVAEALPDGLEPILEGYRPTPEQLEGFLVTTRRRRDWRRSGHLDGMAVPDCGPTDDQLQALGTVAELAGIRAARECLDHLK